MRKLLYTAICAASLVAPAITQAYGQGTIAFTSDLVSSLKMQGNYNSSTSYNKNDVVVSSGSAYYALQATTGNAPTNTTYWGLLAVPQSGGSSLSYQGAYSSGTTYASGAIVTNGGSSWVSLQGSNTGNTPASGSSYWGLLAAQGQAGTNGTNGTNGTPGTNGQGFNFRGAWAASTAYNPYDVATYGGSTYTPIAAFTSGSSFNAANWNVVAAQGQAGTPGAAGAGINPDSTKNGALNLAYTGTAPTAPGLNTVQLQQGAAVTTPYILSFPGAPPPDASHTILSFAQNSSGVWVGAWVSPQGTVNVSQIDYWPMSDTSGTDSVSGSNNTLTYSGATATTDSSLGNVLSFSGANSSGAVSSSTTLTNFSNTTAFSVAGWVKTPLSAGEEFLTSINNTDPTYKGWGVLVNTNGSLQLQLLSNASSNNGMNCTTGSGVVSANTLAHIGFSYDGSQSGSGVKFYVNGSLMSSSCSGTLSATFANGNKLGIGRTVDGQNNYTGVIARVHIDSGVDSATTFANYFSSKN